MNFYNHHNSVSFKSHSISVTFRFCAVLVALRALEPLLLLLLMSKVEPESSTNYFESWIPKKIILVTTHLWSSAPMLLSLLLLYFQKVYRVGTNCVPTLLFISDNPELLRNFRNWLGFHLG